MVQRAHQVTIFILTPLHTTRPHCMRHAPTVSDKSPLQATSPHFKRQAPTSSKFKFKFNDILFNIDQRYMIQGFFFHFVCMSSIYYHQIFIITLDKVFCSKMIIYENRLLHGRNASILKPPSYNVCTSPML